MIWILRFATLPVADAARVLFYLRRLPPPSFPSIFDSWPVHRAVGSRWALPFGLGGGFTAPRLTLPTRRIPAERAASAYAPPPHAAHAALRCRALGFTGSSRRSVGCVEQRLIVCSGANGCDLHAFTRDTGRDCALHLASTLHTHAPPSILPSGGGGGGGVMDTFLHNDKPPSFGKSRRTGLVGRDLLPQPLFFFAYSLYIRNITW